MVIRLRSGIRDFFTDCGGVTRYLSRVFCNPYESPVFLHDLSITPGSFIPPVENTSAGIRQLSESRGQHFILWEWQRGQEGLSPRFDIFRKFSGQR
jgi:hypothetical protein